MAADKSAASVGLLGATFMVCASMIGTGVFTSLGFQVLYPFSPFDLLLLWAVGGVMALCGALAYGELAFRIPRSGGETRFLTVIYGRLAGFLAGWVSLIAGFAASIAACSFALASYITPLLARLSGHGRFWIQEAFSSRLAPLILAGITLAALTWINRFAVNRLVRVQNVFVGLKLLLALAFVSSGFLLTQHHLDISFWPTGSVFASLTNPGFAVSLVFVSFSYSGWNAAVYIADDIRDPLKNLPRSLLFGVLIVATLYILINANFLWVAQPKEIAGSPQVAFVAARKIWGANGGDWIAVAIALGLISSISSFIWSAGSVAETLGGEHAAFAWLAKKNLDGRPLHAIYFVSGLAALMLATSSFEAVVKLIGVLIVSCGSLAVYGVFILDRRAKLSNARRTPFYVKLASIIFLLGNTWILFFLVREEPMSCAWGILTLLFGLAIFYFPRRKLTNF